MVSCLSCQAVGAAGHDGRPPRVDAANRTRRARRRCSSRNWLCAALLVATALCLLRTQVVEWVGQIASALAYMHARHVLHRDIKASPPARRSASWCERARRVQCEQTDRSFALFAGRLVTPLAHGAPSRAVYFVGATQRARSLQRRTTCTTYNTTCEYEHWSRIMLHGARQPANVFLMENKAMLGDFGIARVLEDSLAVAMTQVRRLGPTPRRALRWRRLAGGVARRAEGRVLHFTCGGGCV